MADSESAPPRAGQPMAAAGPFSTVVSIDDPAAVREAASDEGAHDKAASTSSAKQRRSLKKRQLAEWELSLASTYLEDARKTRPSRFPRNPSRKQLRQYRLYNSSVLVATLYFFVFLDLALTVFERPAVPGMSVPYGGTFALEIICLSFFTFRLLHYKQFCPAEKFWDKKTIIVAATIALTLLDMLAYIIQAETWSSDDAVRATRILRPVFLVNFSETRQIRRAFRNIRRTIPGILNVVVLLLLFIALFALMALKLFSKKNLYDRKGRPYMDGYWDIYWHLYVLITTANSPDVMMPAYNNKAWYAIFFIAFLLVCMYVFVSIVLAVVYQKYRKHLKNDVRMSVAIRRQSLHEVWRLLKVHTQIPLPGGGHTSPTPVLPLEHFRQVISFLEPKRSLAQILLLWQVLDENGDGYIRKKEFMRVADLLNVSVIEERDDDLLFVARALPRLWHSRASVLLRSVVQHKYFRYFFDLLLLVNAIVIGTGLDEKGKDEEGLSPIEAVFLSLFNLEIFLKLYTLGFWRFFHGNWNVFDFIVIELATLISIIQEGRGEYAQEAVDILLVLRVLRVIRIVSEYQRFKAVIGTILQIGPSFSMYGVILFMLFYVYAIIGMEAFHGKIEFNTYQTNEKLGVVTDANINSTSWLLCNNPRLNGTDFADFRYCANNFNNILRSYVTLFEMMVVNQWHILTQGFVAVTNKAARLYFLSFHLLCIFVVLNIFVAFILEAFMLQKDFHQSGEETLIEGKIRDMGVGKGMEAKETALSQPVMAASHGMTNNMSRQAEYTTSEDGPEQTDRSNVTGQEHPRRQIRTVSELAAAAGMHFKLGTRMNNMEILLQRMFEEELKREDAEDRQTYAMMDSDEESLDEDEETGVNSFYQPRTTNKVTAQQSTGGSQVEDDLPLIDSADSKDNADIDTMV